MSEQLFGFGMAQTLAHTLTPAKIGDALSVFTEDILDALYAHCGVPEEEE